MLQIHYWRGIREALEKIGAKVVIAKVPGTGGIRERAQQLDTLLDSRLASEQVNIVGHSMGGLDARYLITHINPKTYSVASLTTVCTPHRGSPFMDWCRDYLSLGYRVDPDQLIRDFAMVWKPSTTKNVMRTSTPTISDAMLQDRINSIINHAIGNCNASGIDPADSRLQEFSQFLTRLLGENASVGETSQLAHMARKSAKELDYLGRSMELLKMVYRRVMATLDTPAYACLTTDYCQQFFNPSTPDAPGVEYLSIGAHMDPADISDKVNPLIIPHDIIYKSEGPNDGFVSLSSAQWGHYLGSVSLELLAYFVIREIVALYEYVAIWRGRLGKLYGRLFAAPNYQAYLQLATVLDQQMGINLDNPKTLSHYYDAPLLMRITESLHELRLPVENSNADRKRENRRRNVVALCDLLQQGALKANAGGWENRQIWSCSYSESTRVVNDYIEETVACIDCVRKSKDISPSEKLQFFRQVARQQGRMALCLSGGAAMGWKHLGVARCLLDEARLPRVISGTSAGSLVAALLGTHTDSELRQIIRPELVKYMTACQGSEWKRLTRWLCKGYYFDAVEWAPRAQVFTRGSLTFLEAFERTGKLLNISCTPMGHRYSPRKLLNYITAPNVIIWSAVLASACLPGVMQPMVLLMKTRDGQVKPYTDSGVLWRDGSFRNDIPSTDLRASLNVQFTVVSQVNPHVSLFFYDRDGSIGQPPARRYSSVWRGGFIPSALEHMLKLDIRKWLRLLSDLNLMPLILSQDWSFVWLQKFDGDVTILPKSRISEYFKLLTDPTYNSIVQSIDEGTVATWPKLKMIKTRQGMEDAITRGWIEAYYECTRSSHLMRSIPTKVAMDVARTAKSIDQSEQRSKSTISKAYEALSDVSDNENSVVFRALHSMHPQTGLLNRHKLTHKERHRLRNRRQHALASNKYPKPTYAQILAEEDCSSSSIAEDVWTG
ncbi:hypothetical protein LPJ55_002243 [Coemansia sp. RSA 990]|nr:hypothetical protein LPJ55_002243 [Coemansia sp. RSA 990]